MVHGPRAAPCTNGAGHASGRTAEEEILQNRRSDTAERSVRALGSPGLQHDHYSVLAFPFALVSRVRCVRWVVGASALNLTRMSVPLRPGPCLMSLQK